MPSGISRSCLSGGTSLAHIYLPSVVRFACENGNLADAYGFQFELKPEVMDEIAIACAGDFQNVISAADEGLLEGKDINEYVGALRYCHLMQTA